MFALGKMVTSFQSERDPEQIDGFEEQQNVMPLFCRSSSKQLCRSDLLFLFSSIWKQKQHVSFIYVAWSQNNNFKITFYI